MGVKCIAWALEQPLAGNEKCVLIVLANRARDEDGTCFPGQKIVARQAYVCEKTVERIEKKLEATGFITRKRRFRDNGSRSSDLVSLAVPWAPPDTLSVGIQPTDTRVPDQPTPVSGLKRQEKRQKLENGRARSLTYRSRPVPAQVQRDAETLLNVYRDATGQTVRSFMADDSPSADLKRVWGALIPRPDVTIDKWTETIRAVLKHPWWEGPPSIGVIFGPNVVDQNLEAPLRGGNGNGNGNGRRNGRGHHEDDYDALERAMLANRNSR